MKKIDKVEKLNADPGEPPLEIFSAYRDAIYFKREEFDSILGMREEALILSCVRNGDVEKLRQQINILRTFKLGLLSKNKLRQLKYLFVVAMTLATREAIRGGLSEAESYSLSDVYIQYMDKMDNMDEIINLIYIAIFDFTERVSKQVERNYSPIIKKCNNYVSKNLNYKITIDDLAEECGYSKSYISSTFKKELNCTAMEFIANKKIEAAKEFLTNSDHSIQEIALSLGFASHSNFTSIFKKSVGMTPKEYRNLNYK